MNFHMKPALGVLLISAGCLAADNTPSTPASKPAPAAAAARPSSGNPKADAILDRLDEKGRAIKGLKCRVIYKYVTVEPVEDSQIKEGDLLFARGEPNPRFVIHFEKLIADGLTKPTGEYFAFDGRWLTERNDRARTIVKREIARAGERMDPFRLGKGPFPLPLGQKREDILANFAVTLADFVVGDPPGADHLHCIPVPRTELATKYSRVEIFVDRRQELPVRIVCERISDGNRIEVDLKDININEAPAGSRFQIEEPADYEVTVEPLAPGAITSDPNGVIP